MKAIHLELGQPARLVDIQTTPYDHLRGIFPDGFDGIRLAPDVVGYVGDTSLVDGAPANSAGKALADAVYQQAAGRDYHTRVCGPMVVLGVTEAGESTSVPDGFVQQFLSDLTKA